MELRNKYLMANRVCTKYFNYMQDLFTVMLLCNRMSIILYHYQGGDPNTILAEKTSSKQGKNGGFQNNQEVCK